MLKFISTITNEKKSQIQNASDFAPCPHRLAGLCPRPPALSHGSPARNPRMAEACQVAGPSSRPSPPGSPAAQQLRLLAGLRAPAPARARSRLAGPRPHLVEPPRVVRRRWVTGLRPRPSLPGSPSARRWRLTGPCPRLGGRRESEGGREIGGCVWKKTWGKEEERVRELDLNKIDGCVCSPYLSRAETPTGIK